MFILRLCRLQFHINVVDFRICDYITYMKLCDIDIKLKIPLFIYYQCHFKLGYKSRPQIFSPRVALRHPIRMLIFSSDLTGFGPYYIKADPKSNVAGQKFLDISWCFVKFGLSEGLTHVI